MNTATSYLQPFANAYAGLLQQLATVPQIAELDAYKGSVVGHELKDIAAQRLQEVSLPKGKEFYEEHIKQAHAHDKLVSATGVTPEMWQEVSKQVEVLNTVLSELDDDRRAEWLQSQGVDVNAQNLQEALGPKVTEWLSNPNEALVSARELLKQVKEEKKQAEEDAKRINDPALRDSVANFVANLLVDSKSETKTISTEEAAELIKDNIECFRAHSPEHYRHVLMESAGNFKQYTDEDKKAILEAAMTQYVKAHGKEAEVTAEQIKEQVCCLQPQDIGAMLKTLYVIPSPEYAQAVGAARGERAPVEKPAIQQAAAEKPKGFIERIEAEKDKSAAAVATPGAA